MHGENTKDELFLLRHWLDLSDISPETGHLFNVFPKGGMTNNLNLKIMLL